MSMFTLAICCLTTSNLPWFMDLTFQVPIQYCSLTAWTLLSSLDTSTTECRFWFHPIASFFLELLVIALCSFPVVYWTPSDLGIHLQVSNLFAFSYCLCGFPGKNTGVGCHFLLQWTMFCQNSSLWTIHLGWPRTAWLIASLTYTNPFTITKLWHAAVMGSQKVRQCLATEQQNCSKNGKIKVVIIMAASNISLTLSGW